MYQLRLREKKIGLEKELFDTPSDEKCYTASDEADFQDFEEDLEEQDNLIMRRLLQEEEE